MNLFAKNWRWTRRTEEKQFCFTVWQPEPNLKLALLNIKEFFWGNVGRYIVKWNKLLSVNSRNCPSAQEQYHYNLSFLLLLLFPSRPLVTLSTLISDLRPWLVCGLLTANSIPAFMPKLMLVMCVEQSVRTPRLLCTSVIEGHCCCMCCSQQLQRDIRNRPDTYWSLIYGSEVMKETLCCTSNSSANPQLESALCFL